MKLKQWRRHWKWGRRDQVSLAIGVACVLGLTGCVGYVDGGYAGGAVIAPAPDVVVFGGDYDHGHVDRDYGHRGHDSREDAHRGDRH